MKAGQVDGVLAVLLVDDHTLVREGLRRIIDPMPDLNVVGEAGSAAQALAFLRQEGVDIVVVDLTMPGMSGMVLIERIKVESPDVAVLVLSMHAEEAYALRAIRAGASGYVTKDSAAAELVDALRKVGSGGAYVSPRLAEKVVLELRGGRPRALHTQLSNRELEVLRQIVAGRTVTAIARELNLSPKTVSTHKSRILEKLKLPNLASLIRYGMEHSLLGDGEAGRTP